MDVAASNAEVLAFHARELLIGLGEDPDREGLRETPGRVARALMDLTDGYGMSVEDIVGDALFHEDYDQLVVVRDIPFFSLCEHHLLPFFGVVHVGYVPGGRIIGLSKIPRIVDMFARRLQVQERLTREIAEGLSEIVNPHGVGVVLKADHMCMAMRGVEKIGTTTTTSVWLGSLRDDPGLRADFMRSGG